MDVGLAINSAALSLSLVAVTTSTLLTFRQLKTAQASTVTLATAEFVTHGWQSTEFLRSEDYVLNRLPLKYGPVHGVVDLPFEARQHVQRVAGYYAAVGMVSTIPGIDSRLLLSGVHWRVRNVWDVLAPYIQTERALRNNAYMSHLEHLVCMANSVKKQGLLRALSLRTLPPDQSAPAATAPMPLISPTGLAHFPGCPLIDDPHYPRWGQLDTPNAWALLGEGQQLPATGGVLTLVAIGQCDDCVAHGPWDDVPR